MQDRNHNATPAAPSVHTFRTTAEAYNASQTDDAIRDGDVLVATDERVAGVMVRAWPTAITSTTGEFHSLADSLTWADVDAGRYALAVQVAEAVTFDAPPEPGHSEVRTVATWYNSANRAGRVRAIALDTDGDVFSAVRESPADVWPSWDRIGSGYDLATARRLAFLLSLPSEVGEPWEAWNQ